MFNVTPSTTYSYAPAYRRYQASIRIVHFAGMEKPWQWDRFTDGSVMPRGRGPPPAADMVRLWWKVHDRHIGKWGVNQAAAGAAAGSHSHASAGGFPLQYQPTQHYGYLASSSSSSSSSSSGGGGPPTNPFFGARYNWNESELGLKSGGASSGVGGSGGSGNASGSSSSGGNGKVNTDDLEEDGDGARKLPLKKSSAAAAAAAASSSRTTTPVTTGSKAPLAKK